MGRKVGVYIPPDLDTILDELIQRKKARNISQVVQEALRLYVSELSIEKCIAIGFVNLMYNHKVTGVDINLNDLQHDFIDVVIASSHIHVNKEKCLLSIAVKGESDRITELVYKLRSIHGVLLVKPILLCIESNVRPRTI